MSALPKQIPPQTVPFGTVNADGLVSININWYLLLYNISSLVLGAGTLPPVVYAEGGTLGTPGSGNLVNCTGYTYANLAGAIPTWNQNTSGSAANLTGLTATIANLNTVTGALGTAAFTATGAYQPAGTYVTPTTLNNGSLPASVTTLTTGGYTIAGLPGSPVTGMRAYVTNGVASPAFLSSVSTTGSTVAPVFYNGSGWVYG